MWKRNDSNQPPESGTASAAEVAGRETHARPAAEVRARPGDIANIGQSVIVKGELTGSENLVIDGQVEGMIELRQHVLTIGPSGKIKAEVTAKSVVVLGHVVGNIIATEKIEICEDGSVDGDIAAPRVGIAEGAHFKGSIDMQDAAKVVKTTAPPVGTTTAGATRITTSTPAVAPPRKRPDAGSITPRGSRATP